MMHLLGKDLVGWFSLPALQSLLILSIIIQTSDAQCHFNSTPVVEQSLPIEVLTNWTVIYQCNLGYLPSNGEAIIASFCKNDTWTVPSDTCESSNDSPSICAGDPQVPSDAEPIYTLANVSIAYSCSGEKHWLSGEKVRLSQCVNSNWTDIIDLCEEDWDLPRQCTEIENLGIEDNGYYLMVPTGSEEGSVEQFYCILDDVDYGDPWTLVLNNTVPYSGIKSGFEQGIYNDGPLNNLFIGLRNLADLSKDLNGNYEGMILQVILQTDTDWFHATYDNFTVGPASAYTLESLGNYHGNAGDGLRPHVGTAFLTSMTSWWWGIASSSTASDIFGSYLTASTMVWMPLFNSSGTNNMVRAQMRIRPKAYEADIMCPPKIGSEPYWLTPQGTTSVTIPISRLPETKITYECIKEAYAEGQDGGPRTLSGTAECIDGSPPSWDFQPVLPCTFHCFDPFSESADGKSCLMVSNDKLSFVKASLACLSMNATIVSLVDSSDLNGTVATTKYFVGHTCRGDDETSIQPPVPPSFLCVGLNCGATCNVPQCVQMFGNGSYTLDGSCEDEANYICRMPEPFCPQDFWRGAEGGCYRVIPALGLSFLDVLISCEILGAALAYPTSVYHAEKIVKGVIGHEEVTDETFLIGTNNVDGSWSAGGIYAVNDAMQALYGVSDLNYRTVRILDNGSYYFSSESYQNSSTYIEAICQYYGPIGCASDYPTPIVNMGLTVNSTAVGSPYFTGSIAQFSCDRGYFVNGSAPTVLQDITCYGQLGQWIPPSLLPCIRVAVCENSTVQLPSTQIIVNTTDANSFYVDGIVTYYCPANVTLMDGNTTFEVQCLEDNASPTYFSFLPHDVPLCQVCVGELPVFANGTTDFSSTTKYITDEFVTFTCNTGFEMDSRNTTAEILCTETGWNSSQVNECHKVCLTDPPTGPNMYLNFTVNSPRKVGTVVTLTCNDSFYFMNSADFTDLNTSLTAECIDNGTWYIGDRPSAIILCAQMCVEDPASAPLNGTSTWNGYTKLNGTEITYACSEGYVLGNFESTLNISCIVPAWDLIDNSLFPCKRPCLQYLEATIGSTTTNWTTYGLEGDAAVYQCPPGFGTFQGISQFTRTCEESVWSAAPADFECVKVCTDPVPTADALVQVTFDGNMTEGSVATYTCAGGIFQGTPGKVLLKSTCINSTWTPSVIPMCGTQMLSPELYENFKFLVIPRYISLTNACLVNSLVGSSLYLYSRPHLLKASPRERIPYCIFGAGMFNLGSMLLWALGRTVVPENTALRFVIGLGGAAGLLWFAHKYISFVDSQVPEITVHKQCSKKQ